MACGQVRAPGPTLSAPKQWKLDVHVESRDPVSARSPLTEFEGEKITESAAIWKRAVSLTWHAKWPRGHRVSATCWNWTHVARLTATCLNHCAIGSYSPTEKKVEYQGQNRYTRILDSKPLVDTCDHIGHRLGLNFLLIAHVLLNAHRAACRPQKSENRGLEI